MKKYLQKLKNSKGFTLAEVLIVIAIIAILGGVATVGATNMIKNTRQKSLDRMAETIFIVAERNIQAAALQGKGDKLGTPSNSLYEVRSTEAGGDVAKLVLPANSVSEDIYHGKWLIRYKVGNESYHISDVYFTTANNEYASSFDGADVDALTVQYSAKSGKVGYYGGGGIDSLPVVDGLKHDRIYAAVNVENTEELGVMVYVKLPDYEKNKGYYNGSAESPRDTTYTLEIVGATSGNKVKIERKLNGNNYASSYVNNKKACLITSTSYAEFVDYIALDNLKTSSFRKFADGTAAVSGGAVYYFNKSTGEYATTAPVSDNAIKPGEDIIISISAECAGEKSAQYSDAASDKVIGSSTVNFAWAESAQTNSLYASRALVDAETDQVEIAYGRHLQNLDSAISGIPTTGTYAKKLQVVQTQTIDFKTADATYNEGLYNKQWAQIYTGFTWTPIRNEKVESYDGGVVLTTDGTIDDASVVKGIKNLTVTYSDTRAKSSNSTVELNRKLYGGLFGDYFGSKIENVACENFVIDFYRSNSVPEKSTAAACIIGRAKKHITIKNCRVDKAEITVGQSMSASDDKTIIAGIVAHVWAGADIQNCYTDRSIIIGYQYCCYAAGIVAFSCSGNYSPDIPVRDTSDLIIKNCKCSQSVIGAKREHLLAGGICTYTFNNLVDIEDCILEGVSITTYGTSSNAVSIIGGMVAHPDSQNTVIKNCKVYNTDDNTAAFAASGIGNTGVYEKAHLTKARNYVNSTVTGSGATYDARNLGWFYSHGGPATGEDTNHALSTVGGITGYVLGIDNTVIEDCYAATNIITYNNYGINAGISGNGRKNHKITVKNSYADCYITGEYIAGIAGNCMDTSTFTDCYAAGFLRCDNAIKAAGICTNKATVTGCYSLMNYDNIWDTAKFTSANLTFSDGYVSSYPSEAKPNTTRKNFVYLIAGDNSTVDENTYYTYGGEGDWIKDQTAQTSNKAQYASLSELVTKLGEQTQITPYKMAPACISDNLPTAKLPKMVPAAATIASAVHYGDWLEKPGNQLYARVYKTSDNKYVMFFEKGGRKSTLPTNSAITLTTVGEWLADDAKPGNATSDSGFLRQADNGSAAAAQLVAPWQYNGTGNVTGWTASTVKSISSVTFDDYFCKDKTDNTKSNAKPKSMRRWFKGFEATTVFNNIEKLDVSEVTNMAELFRNCYEVLKYDLSTWNTANVTSMQYMFGMGITDIPIPTTANDTENSINRLAKTTEIKFGPKFVTANVTDMAAMFKRQGNLTSIDISGFNFSNVTDMEFMFDFCKKMTSIVGFTNVDASKVTNMNHLFYNDLAMPEYDLSGWITSKTELKITRSMFGTYRSDGNAHASKIIIGENFFTDAVYDMGYMFQSQDSVKELNLTSFNTGSVTHISQMFFDCKSLKTIYASEDFVVPSSATHSGMFDNCNVLVGGCGTKWSSKSGSSKTDRTYAWIDGRSGNPYAGGSSEGYFTNIRTQLFARIYKINDNPDYELIFEAGSAQSGKKLIEEYPGSEFLYEKADADILGTDAKDWVAYAPWHKKWGSSDPVRENIVRASFTDEFCEAAKPVTMRNWFADMHKLSSVDFNDLDTSDVVNMMGLFSGAYSSTGTNELTSLDLSVFDTSSIVRVDCMFRNCKKLKTIRVSDDFNVYSLTAKNSADMFQNCENLVGGCGTAWSEKSSGNTNIDRKYAWIDGKDGNPNDGGSTLGYFTSEEFDGLHARIYERSNGDYYMYFEMGSVSQHEGGGTLVAEWKGDGPNGFLNKLASDENSKAAAPWYQSSKGDWSYASGRNKIKKVIFREAYCDRAQPRALRNYFIGMENLTDIEGISTLDVSKVQYANGAFAECYSLEELDLSEWNTSSLAYPKVMFRNCNKLRTIFATTDFTVASVVDGSGMFENCQVLVGGNGTAWADQSGAAKTNKTYAWVDGVENNPNTLDTKGYFTLPVLYARVYKDSSNNYVLVFEAGYAKSKYGTFVEGLEWEGSNAGGFLNTSSRPWRTSQSGYNYSSVKKVIFDKNFTSSNKARPVDLSHWFEDFSSLTTIEGMENLDARNVTTMEDMFLGCTSLTGTLDFSKWSTPVLKNMSRTFYCHSGGLKVSKILFGENFDVSNVTNMWALFGRCSKVEELDLSYWNTRNVREMQYMFIHMTALTKIYASEDFVVTQVTSSGNMFEFSGIGDNKLVGGSGTKYSNSYTNKAFARIDKKSNDPSLGGYFTLKTPAVYERVYDVGGQKVLRFEKYPQGDTIFSEGTVVQGALLTTNSDGSFDGNVTWDSVMGTITSVEVNTPIKPAKTDNWFKDATALTSVDFKYNTGTATTTSMASMFEGCTAITAIDIRNLNVSSVTSFNNMFKNCSSLVTIFARKNFATDAASGATGVGMFTGCTKPLVGAKGTSYITGNDGIEYAHVDVDGSPGYFTQGEVYEPDGAHAGISHVTITLPGGGTREAWYYNGVFYNTEAEAIAAWTKDNPSP